MPFSLRCIENCGPSCVNNIFLHGKVGLPKGNVVFWFWESIMWYCVRCILSHSYPWLVYNPYILLVNSLFFSCLHSRWFDAKHPHPVSHLYIYIYIFTTGVDRSLIRSKFASTIAIFACKKAPIRYLAEVQSQGCFFQIRTCKIRHLHKQMLLII